MSSLRKSVVGRLILAAQARKQDMIDTLYRLRALGEVLDLVEACSGPPEASGLNPTQDICTLQFSAIGGGFREVVLDWDYNEDVWGMHKGPEDDGEEED